LRKKIRGNTGKKKRAWFDRWGRWWVAGRGSEMAKAHLTSPGRPSLPFAFCHFALGQL
jgi:hypothetical protein